MPRASSTRSTARHLDSPYASTMNETLPCSIYSLPHGESTDYGRTPFVHAVLAPGRPCCMSRMGRLCKVGRRTRLRWACPQ
eukprot:scaffold163725_cov27-Tisochrysis_lutea.AAC.2